MMYSLGLTCGLVFSILCCNYVFDCVSGGSELKKTCIVNGTTYFDRQTISLGDEGCQCICIASNVYCWWQDNDNGKEEFDVLRGIDAPKTSGNVEYKERVTCSVMGKKYEVGEKLAYSTGNCLECSCGQKGSFECWPRHCGADPESADMSEISSSFDSDDVYFDGGGSENHGIDENFV